MNTEYKCTPSPPVAPRGQEDSLLVELESPGKDLSLGWTVLEARMRASPCAAERASVCEAWEKGGWYMWHSACPGLRGWVLGEGRR